MCANGHNASFGENLLITTTFIRTPAGRALWVFVFLGKLFTVGTGGFLEHTP
jgi:hypothetical protein